MAWRRANRERLAAIQREYARANRARLVAVNRLAATGMTADHYDRMMKAQEGRCAICRIVFGGAGFADHKHTTPPFPRGLLCRKCNSGIGLLGDSPDLLRAAAAYIEAYETRRQVVLKGEPMNVADVLANYPPVRPEHKEAA